MAEGKGLKEITADIVIAMIEKGMLAPIHSESNGARNENTAEEVAKMYKTIYLAVSKPTD